MSCLACVRPTGRTSSRQQALAGSPQRKARVFFAIPPFYPISDGEFAKVPVLMGNMDSEDGYGRIAAYRNSIVPAEEEGEEFHLMLFTYPIAFSANIQQNQFVPAWT